MSTWCKHWYLWGGFSVNTAHWSVCLSLVCVSVASLGGSVGRLQGSLRHKGLCVCVFVCAHGQVSLFLITWSNMTAYFSACEWMSEGFYVCFHTTKGVVIRFQCRAAWVLPLWLTENTSPDWQKQETLKRLWLQLVYNQGSLSVSPWLCDHRSSSLTGRTDSTIDKKSCLIESRGKPGTEMSIYLEITW